MCIEVMRIFLDTNVLLDVYLKRDGAGASGKVISACGEPWNEGLVAMHTLSNAFYIIEHQQTRADAWDFIRDVLAWAVVAGVSTDGARRTMNLQMKDFEDALQVVAAESSGAEVIVTRNLKDFTGKTAIPIMLPENFQDQPPIASP